MRCYCVIINNSLYILAEQNNLPNNQYLDAATLDWIIEKGVEAGLSFNEIDKEELAPILSSLDRAYRYASQFLFDDAHYARGSRARATIHGDLHAYRVSLLASAISSVKPYDVSVIMAGLYHDIARKNDKADEGHGVRSSKRALRLNLIPTYDQKCIIEAISHHEDELLDVQKNELALLVKTADALDRFRLPKIKWWPDKEKMQYVPSTTIFKVAYWLMLDSELEFIKTKDAQHSISLALTEIKRRAGV